jgi:peptidoglycan/LPS O-acetylase OafA/YrhL
MKYRPEIDGLRALAVIPVILFHAGFDLFSGGYLGVDIFFVISGYLITTIIIQELTSGHFTLSGFYERRVRRIFPALAFLILATIPLAWLCLPPDAMSDYALSLIGVATFSSNFVFWKQDGYFETAAELTPLLHTWSLAVEEQFYLIFPLAMLIVWKFGKKVIVVLCLVGFLLSLLIAQWATQYAVRGGFFLLPPRGWELLIGTFCAFYLQWRCKTKGHHVRAMRWHQALSLCGLAMVLYAIFGFDSLTPTPSLYTLIPTLGAAFIILYANQGTFVQTLLSQKVLVRIGLISYSAYLWHHPVFVFYRYNTLAEPPHLTMLALSIFSLALGWMSWKFIEQPFRQKNRIRLSTVYKLAALFTLILIGFGIAGYINKGFPKRVSISLPENLQWNSLGEKFETLGYVCDFKTIEGTQNVLGCEYGDITSDETIVIYGDSHAEAMSYALDKTMRDKGIKVLQLDINGCENIPYFRQNNDMLVTDCAQRYEEFLAYVQSLSTDVILINRWTFKLFPLDGYDVTMPYKNSLGHLENESYREYGVYDQGAIHYDPKTKEKFLEIFIKKLAAASKTLFLVYPVPEMAGDIARANILYRNKTGEILQEIAIPYSDYESRNAFVISVFDKLDVSHIKRIKPSEIFCNSFSQGHCMAQYDSVPFYLDDDHLSDIGAQMIIDEIIAERQAQQ